ncbi:hypothetical protein M1B72_09530 [Geomonas paludis]|uniref:Uncharacterized protein n=1 Tax=Geomonas paludis TaxID=2740185 RepID=A0ABY4LN64_9BACT|nr:hypothetical protein [Geomonas paludis]UPU37928.1 hypothetical protein M1B72_09530 [Geomonas paludis]
MSSAILQGAVGSVAAPVDMGISLHAVNDRHATLKGVRVVACSIDKGAEDHCEKQEREKFEGK